MAGERGLRATSFVENGKKGGEDENGTAVNIANIFSAKEDFEEVPDSEEEEEEVEVEDIHVSEVESDYEDLPPPSPPSPPPPPPPPIVEEDPPVEEVVEEEEEEEEEEERQPSAKSLPVGHIVPHRER